MPDVLTTVRALISHGTAFLRQAGLPEPRREAFRIWTALSDCSAADATLGGGQTANAELATLFERAIARRARGEPLAHVTGKSGFRHLTLMSDRRALIPRPETEGIVELLLPQIRTGRVLDVGTGSGCIGFSLAQEGEFNQVVGVDCSSEALLVARANRERLDSQVTLVEGDLCRPFRGEVFDALISNPPYLTVAEYAALDTSVRDWEPEAALVSGPDGLSATTRLLDEGRFVLRPAGWLALEVDCTRAAEAARRARALGWLDVTVHMDLFGRERYLLARRSNTR